VTADGFHPTLASDEVPFLCVIVSLPSHPFPVFQLGANFWGTDDFSILRAKTRDSAHDASLVSIAYSRIFIDEELDASIASPPPGSIFDGATMTIGGTVFENLVIRVPAGKFGKGPFRVAAAHFHPPLEQRVPFMYVCLTHTCSLRFLFLQGSTMQQAQSL